jgi:small subunit ribosomal protein S20
MLKEIKGLKEKAAILESLPKVQALVDKSVKRGLVHKNTAARIKSKLMRNLVR